MELLYICRCLCLSFSVDIMSQLTYLHKEKVIRLSNIVPMHRSPLLCIVILEFETKKRTFERDPTISIKFSPDRG